MGIPSATPMSAAKRGTGALAGLALALGLSSIAVAAQAADVANVDDARIIGNAKTGKEWLSNGLDYSANRFSPLDQITTANVGKLGLAWSYPLELGSAASKRPQSLSTGSCMSQRHGPSYPPSTPRPAKRSGRSIPSRLAAGVSAVLRRRQPRRRGLQGQGLCRHARLAPDRPRRGDRQSALDCRREPDRARPYTLTAAPLVIRGKVFVGGGGGEYGVRGVLSAFDAETGKLAWRWYTVPGDPSKPVENEAMAKAAATWDDKFPYWQNGGGGTVWNTISADPDLNLLYFGTGNAGPWSSSIRNPSGKDNLYTSSVVALDIDTGKYAWHYQGTPADSWDYDADQDPILADLTIDGQKRQVLLHAAKNGFFYVLDRKTGQFISAKNFVDVNWARGYTADGKPIEIPGARGTDKPVDAIPGPFGAHNWQSMSYSPKTGFAYIPAQNVPLTLVDDPTWTKQGSAVIGQFMNGNGWNLGRIFDAAPPTSKPFGRLVAWDAANQKAAWTQDYASPWNGGTLATAGGLVFQGTADGRLVAYDATSGEKLWDAPLGNGVVAAPMTYEIDGKQYVSVAVGWGGAFGLSQRSTDHASPGTVYTFAIGGDTKPPEVTRYKLGPLISGVKYDPKDVPEGVRLYVSNCVNCHGVPGVDRGGNIPNLGYVDCGRDRESGQGGVQQRVCRSGHAGFHRQAEARGHRKDQGVHPGHRRRDPAEVTLLARSAR